MFLLVSGRHVGAHTDGHQHGLPIQISINLGKTFLRISCIRIISVTRLLARVFAYLPSFISHILDFIYWTVLIFILIYFEWRDTENQQLEFGDAGFCGGRKTKENGEKALEKGENPQQTQPTYGTRSELKLGHIGGRWACAHTTAPSLLPKISETSFQKKKITTNNSLLLLTVRELTLLTCFSVMQFSYIYITLERIMKLPT